MHNSYYVHIPQHCNKQEVSFGVCYTTTTFLACFSWISSVVCRQSLGGNSNTVISLTFSLQVFWNALFAGCGLAQSNRCCTPVFCKNSLALFRHYYWSSACKPAKSHHSTATDFTQRTLIPHWHCTLSVTACRIKVSMASWDPGFLERPTWACLALPAGHYAEFVMSSESHIQETARGVEAVGRPKCYSIIILKKAFWIT